MPDGGIQLYEAIVIDSAPDAAFPGHIKVRIPELFGDDIDVPVLIAPLFPGWAAGGWQSVPGIVNPDDDETEVRVVVAHLARNTFRWMGTSQAYDFITDNPGTRAGARSGDGRHAVYLDNGSGFFVEVGSDANVDLVNLIAVGADDTILIQTSDGSLVNITKTQVTIKNSSDDILDMNDGDVKLMQKDGVSYLSLATGDVTTLAGTTVQVNGGTIELGGGVSSPGDAYILSSTLLTDLSTVMAEIAVGLALIPSAAVSTLQMVTDIATSLASGAPYLSTRIFGD